MKGKKPAKAEKKGAVAAKAPAKGMPPAFMKGAAKKPDASMAVEGPPAKRRLDKPGRKLGGRIGADRAPLSSGAATAERSSGGEC